MVVVYATIFPAGVNHHINEKILEFSRFKSDILLLYIYNTSINQHVIKSQYYLETFFIALLDDNIGPCSNVSTLF